MLLELLNWWKQYRLDIIAAKAKADNYQSSLLADVVKSQTELTNKWLSGFNLTELPSSSVTRDDDAYAAEQDRQREQRSGELPPELAQSIRNSIMGGAFPDLKDML